MHEPERLLDGDLRPVERNILRAAEQDAPSEAARAAARAALGLDAPPPPPPAKPSWPIAAASGAVLVGALWLGVSLISVAPPPPAPAPAPAVTPVEAPRAPALPALAPDLFVGPEAPPAPVAKAPRPTPRRPKKAAPAPRAGGSLAEELRALDRAREALGKSEAQAALRTLDSYGRRFPSGVLRPEAAVLRVKALVAVGRVDTARRALAKLRRDSPSHPALPELSRLLEGR